MTSKEERWVPLRNIPGYLVSCLGRVRSLKKDKILRPHTTYKGYKKVGLSHNGIPESKFVHRLVLEAFTEQPTPTHQACHINGIRDDNRLENLQWGTPKENQSHRKLHGTYQCGEKLVQSKLTNENVLDIVKAYKANTATRVELSKKFGVDRNTIYKILNGSSWANVTGIKKEEKPATLPQRAEQIATAALLEVYGCTNMEFLIQNSNEAAEEDMQIIAKHIKRALKQADDRLQLAEKKLKTVTEALNKCMQAHYYKHARQQDEI